MQKNFLSILLFCAGLLALATAIFFYIHLKAVADISQPTQQQLPSVVSPSLLPTPSPRSYISSAGKRPQFVVLSFDGSKSLPMWEATRAFAAKMNHADKPVHFTYFISGVYFTPEASAKIYHPPHHKEGESAIGFADSAADIAARVHQINLAVAEGHEIGSHANGHYDGSRWTEAEWTQEFDQFNHLVFDWQSRYPEQKSAEQLVISAKDVIGFRAPLLAHNDAMYASLAQLGYRYDGSGASVNVLPTSLPKGWPVKEKHQIWMIPLNSVPLAGTRSSILAMDYNFFLTQTRGKDNVRRGSPSWQKLYGQMYSSYMAQFNSSYAGERAPVIIGHHFSTWNDGVYWQVMQNFAEEVCGRPEVYCVSFRELTDYLDAQK